MSVGFWQIVVIAILALLLFGRGRISDLMGDVAKGIKSFKKGLNDEENTETTSREKDMQKQIPDTQKMQDITPTTDKNSSYKSFD